MNPEQTKALLEAVREGNDVRIVTIALQIAAALARERKQDDAIAIRKLVDDHQSRDSAALLHRQKRLEIAMKLLCVEKLQYSVREAVDDADELIELCATKPVIGEKP